ncbi:MAG: PD-(D/E)XK nuclease family protein, partial [Proteobacteria bacterium]|nr:PD-(D/E)XK nuclease family protein [Pseudomonadota bacterium]
SVRVLGLAEGVVPSSTREDPVLPDAVRARLGPAVRRTADRSLAQLHALHRVVLGTPRVVLSAPRMDIEGRYREPSGVLLEALAALGRPPLGQGAVVIPDRQLMRQLAFEPARAHADALRDRWPVDDRGRLTRAALHAQISQPWADDARFPLRPAEIAEPSVMDGWFPDGDFIDLPGLSEERPISASAFARLLDCPQRFLYERVLGWHPPPELVTEGSIDALSYGSLFHAIAEDFYRLHGAAFCAKTAPLDHWHQVAAGFASRHFAAFVDGYPLVGQDVQLAHQARLHRDVRALLVADWEVAKTFVDVERSFGPMPLPVGPADDVSTLYVRGFIDRIDTIGATTLVRDLKTGRAKPRSESEGFLPAYDLQLGLYGLVTHVNATTWSVPATIEATYVYPSDPSGDERSYADDYDQLAAATASWMTIGRDLLVHQQFPRTPRAEDCTFCAFKPVCGPHATARAAALLAAPPASQASFAALKIEAPEDD